MDNYLKRGGTIIKTIGLIGGLSWQSSAHYYRLINELVAQKLGAPHSCQSVMYSVNFALIERLQHQGQWQLLSCQLKKIAKKLEGAGADLLLICSNTMHRVAGEIEAEIKVPLLHIADAAAEEIKKRNMERVGLLGTSFTMEQGFYRERLQDHGIDVMVPAEEERRVVHQVIYRELIAGIFSKESREQYQEIIDRLRLNGAEGVVLGCTEIPLLMGEEDSSLPLFDTTELHASRAVEVALE